MLKRDLRQLIADSLAFLYALIGWNRIAFFEHKFGDTFASEIAAVLDCLNK